MIDKDEIQKELDSILWYHDFTLPDDLKINFLYCRETDKKYPNTYQHFKNIWSLVERELNLVDFNGKSVLDIGCWDGYWSFLAEQSGASEVLATDCLSKSWATGKGIHLIKKILKSNIKIKQELDVYDITTLNKTFDIILFLDVFMHLQDFYYALSQIRHICHNQTQLIISGTIQDLPINKVKYTFNDIEKMPYEIYNVGLSAETLTSFLDLAYFDVARFSKESNVFVAICKPFCGENKKFHCIPPFNLVQYDTRWNKEFEQKEIQSYISIGIPDIRLYNKYCNFVLHVDKIETYGDIYEFGVYGGKSLQQTIENLDKHNIKYNKIFGFDSFEGLPNLIREFESKTFTVGEFNSQKLYHTNKDGVKQAILDRTKDIPILIDGWFSNTLTSELVKQYDMQPASFINIDCDLYISTYQALDFIFSNNLWQPGTIIRYDDWSLEHTSGEEIAHNEIMTKYNINCEQICQQHHIRYFKIIGENT